MTFWKAFLVSYTTMLGLFLFVMITTYVLHGRPRHPHFALALLVFGVPACAAVSAWGETRRRR